MKGMYLSVYRNAQLGDNSNGGVSGKVTRIILIGEGIPEIFEAGPDDVVLKLVRRDFHDGPYFHAEPVDQPKEMAGPMFGGSFCYTSDSRISRITKYPIPIHDRFETWELYNALSL
jgi:hypothetical protein